MITLVATYRLSPIFKASEKKIYLISLNLTKIINNNKLWIFSDDTENIHFSPKIIN